MAGSVKGEAIRCLGIELGGDGAAEWMDGRRVVFVPREAILSIDVRHGIAGERPALQAIFGIAAVLVGFLLLSSLTGALDDVWRGGSRLAARLAAAGAPVMLVGGWVLWNGLRPAYYLRVRTAADTRKLLLAKNVDLAQLSKALHDASGRFGYAVAWQIEDPRPDTSELR